ncbi:pyruvate, phosphate dikinase [Tanacetum coccineum]
MASRIGDLECLNLRNVFVIMTFLNCRTIYFHHKADLNVTVKSMLHRVASTASDSGVLCGAGISALARAVFSVEVLKASRAYWFRALSVTRNSSTISTKGYSLKMKELNLAILNKKAYEFLPDGDLEQIVGELTKDTSMTKDAIYSRIEKLLEVNPMLGFRGCMYVLSHVQCSWPDWQ